MPNPTQSRTHWLVAAGATWAMIASGIHLTGLSILTPFVTEQLGFETGPYQLYYSLLSVATMVTMPVAGRLIGSLGARKLLMIGGLCSAGGLLGMATASQLWQFYLAGIVTGLGIGLGCLYVPAVIVTTWFVAKRGAVMGVVMAGSGIGGIGLSQLLPRLIGDGEGWRMAFITLAILMLVCTLGPALLLIRNHPADLGLRPLGEDPSPTVVDATTPLQPVAGLSFSQALCSPWFWLLYLMLALLGLATAIYQGLSVHLRLIGQTERLGLILTALTVSLVLAKVVIGILVDVIGVRASMFITFGLYIAACLAMPGVTSTGLLLVLMIGIAIGTANATVLPPLVGAITVGPRDFPAIWGIGATAFSLGNAVGTPLWGTLKDATGDYTTSFQLIPVLVVILTAGLIVTMNRGRASYRHTLPS